MAEHAPSVLVVEDNPVGRVVAVRMLERIGCAVRAVSSGAEAVACAAAERFDLILMDCRLPDMDGTEAARAIRGGPHGGVPIVALTAADEQQLRERCTSAGMSAFLVKPLDIAELSAAVARWASAEVAP